MVAVGGNGGKKRLEVGDRIREEFEGESEEDDDVDISRGNGEWRESWREMGAYPISSLGWRERLDGDELAEEGDGGNIVELAEEACEVIDGLMMIKRITGGRVDG